jgi:hypothetical protein
MAKNLAEEQDVHDVYGLGNAGLFDELFHFLHELKVMELLEQLMPRKHPVPFSVVLLIYLIRIVSGLKFFYYIEPVLLQSQAIMLLVGFNGHQVRQGVNRRSLDKSQIAYEKKIVLRTEVRYALSSSLHSLSRLPLKRWSGYSINIIEDVFKQTKDGKTGTQWPMFHWTGRMIRVHGLYCSLSLLIRAMILKKNREAEIPVSMIKLHEKLSGIREVLNAFE